MSIFQEWAIQEKQHWSRTEVEVGTRFSLLSYRQTVVVVPSHNCKGCINRNTPTNLKRTACLQLPPCHDRLFLPDTPEALAEYVAAQLEN